MNDQDNRAEFKTEVDSAVEIADHLYMAKINSFVAGFSVAVFMMCAAGTLISFMKGM